MRLDRKLVLAVLIVAVCFVPLVLPNYWVFLATMASIAAIITRSVGVVTNQTGLLSLCQMSFAAVGGWIVAWLNNDYPEVPFTIAVLIGACVAAAVGAVIGFPALRVRGVELAVVTLGFAAVVDLFLSQRSFPGAGVGKAVMPGDWLIDPSRYFLLCWLTFVGACLVLWIFGHRRLGLSWTAVRSSERAAAGLGLRVPAAKITAFAAAAALAGLGGGLLAGLLGLLTVDTFTPVQSLTYFALAVMVGAGLASGALLGGVLTVAVPELLRRFNLPLDLGAMIFALGAIDTLRRGHGGIAEQWAAQGAAKRFRDARKVCVMTPPGVGLSSPGSRPILEVRGLTVAYGNVKALSDVTLTVDGPSVWALIGPNGAGKSTFIDAVSGFVSTYEGDIVLDGRALDGLAAHRRARAGLRRTFQQGRAIDALTIAQYLRIAGSEGESPIAPEELVEYFGLPDLEVPISLLDVGSRRIVEVAAALSARPILAMLDEPAAGLDTSVSRELALRIGAVPTVFGTSVLLVEHDIPHVRAAASHVTVLDFGEVLAEGTVDEVLRDPRVIAAYLGQEVH